MRYALMIVVPLLVAGCGSDENDEPAGPIELCDLLTDPENDVLTIGDIEDLFDMTGGQLRTYVNNRCPELLPRVVP